MGYTAAVAPAIDRAFALRAELESFVVRDIRDARRKQQLHEQAIAALDDARLLADIVIGAAIAHGNEDDLDAALISVETYVPALLRPDGDVSAQALARQALQDVSQRWLQTARADPSVDRCGFHWALELPEVRVQGGFNAIVGNPPFLGNKYWKDTSGRGCRALPGIYCRRHQARSTWRSSFIVAPMRFLPRAAASVCSGPRSPQRARR
jgi:hypothetical protein